jgi:hypothetical protein
MRITYDEGKEYVPRCIRYKSSQCPPQLRRYCDQELQRRPSRIFEHLACTSRPIAREHLLEDVSRRKLHLTTTLTRKDTLEILKIVLEATVSLGFPLLRIGLKKLTMYILQLLVDLAFKFADNEVRKRLSGIKPRTRFWSFLFHSSPNFASRS